MRSPILNQTTMLIQDAMLIDGTGSDPVPRSWLLLRDGRVSERGSGRPPSARGLMVLDAAGRTVMPGLIDAHTHLAATAHPPWTIPPVEHVLAIADECEQTLSDGFTTVRDAAGLSPEWSHATASGRAMGPRLLVSDASIGQTGGHGDTRRLDDLAPVHATSATWRDSLIADGADEVRRATREVLRRGAAQVKLMAGGGCISPADPIDAPQLTVTEIRAAVEQAADHGTYVMAHAYLPESIERCLIAGVRSIEHGNLLDQRTADMLAAGPGYLVPTLATYELLATEGVRLGYDPAQIAKIAVVRAHAEDALRMAFDAGVRIGSGSDLLAGHQRHKALELELKARVMGASAAITAATSTNADLLGRPDLGRLTTSSVADLLIVDGSPTEDITVLQDRSRIHAVVTGGRIRIDRLPETATGVRRQGVN